MFGSRIGCGAVKRSEDREGEVLGWGVRSSELFRTVDEGLGSALGT